MIVTYRTLQFLNILDGVIQECLLLASVLDFAASFDAPSDLFCRLAEQTILESLKNEKIIHGCVCESCS